MAGEITGGVEEKMEGSLRSCLVSWVWLGSRGVPRLMGGAPMLREDGRFQMRRSALEAAPEG